jgi:hypothetical protein
MRQIAVIEDPTVIEKVLRHLKLRCGLVRFAPAHERPSAELREPEPEFIMGSTTLPEDGNVLTG